MAFVQAGDRTLDYFPCHYGRSRLTFRGPQRDLTREYLAVLGGSETYGRYVMAPFAALIEDRLGLPVANLACQNAGPDVYLGDRGAIEVASQAHVAVLQVLGAQNQTNRFYTVHPRRNDRFVAATPLLRSLYREVDFTEIHFTRHLVHLLMSFGSQRFAPILAELQRLWVERMTAILTRLPRRRILLWMADHPPQDGPQDARSNRLAPPLFVDRAMIEQVRPLASVYLEHTASGMARAEGLRAMRFPLHEEGIAQALPGAAEHQELAECLCPVIEALQ